MNKNNVHVAYLRHLQETMKIRAKRIAIANSMHIDKTPESIERLRNKHLACLRWEKIHGAV